MTKYEKWYKLSMELAAIKKAEAQLRREICADLFDGRQGEFKVDKETQKFTVTATSKVTRKLDPEAFSAIASDLSDAEKEAVKYTPSLDTRKWRKLPEGSLLNEAVIEKPAMPTLAIKVKI